MTEVNKICDSMWEKLSPFTNQHAVISKLKSDLNTLLASKCKEQRERCAEQFTAKNRYYSVWTMRDKADLCLNAPLPKI